MSPALRRLKAVRPVILCAVLLFVWQGVIWLTGVPSFMLPPPLDVAKELLAGADIIALHAGYTVTEIIAGLILGAVLGAVTALPMALFAPVRFWLMPVLLVSQAIPVFALAPLLVLWLGFGMSSKITMAAIIIYFPVTVAFFDGLRRTDPGWLALAGTMGAGRYALLRHVRLPAALPAFASGMRVAAAVAPIGAIVGEWVGASHGLGYLMLHANARVQIDLVFACLIVICLYSVAQYALIDRLLTRLLPWQPDSIGASYRH